MIQIQWTCQSLDEAKKIAKALLEKRLIACANILPHVESLYPWEGKIQEDQEVKVFLKTLDEHFAKVRDYIRENASYDVPEISKILIADGNPDYLDWMTDFIQ